MVTLGVKAVAGHRSRTAALKRFSKIFTMSMHINGPNNFQSTEFHPQFFNRTRLRSPALIRPPPLLWGGGWSNFFPGKSSREFWRVRLLVQRERPLDVCTTNGASVVDVTGSHRTARTGAIHDYRALDARRDASTDDIETTPPLPSGRRGTSGNVLRVLIARLAALRRQPRRVITADGSPGRHNLPPARASVGRERWTAVASDRVYRGIMTARAPVHSHRG